MRVRDGARVIRAALPDTGSLLSRVRAPGSGPRDMAEHIAEFLDIIDMREER